MVLMVKTLVWLAVAAKKSSTTGSMAGKSHEVCVGVGGDSSATAIRGYGYQSASLVMSVCSAARLAHAASWIGDPRRSGGFSTTCSVIVVRVVATVRFQSTESTGGATDCGSAW